MTNPDYYEILGVNPGSDESVIKKAYRALSLKYHPDRNSTAEAKDLILKINEAYETLGDPDRRNKYDMQSNVTNMVPDEMFSGMNNMFNMMFNGNVPPGIQIFHTNGQRFQFMERPVPINCEATITMAQSYSGCIYKIDITRTIKTNNVSSTENECIFANIPKGIASTDTITFHDKGNILNQTKGPLHIKIKIINDNKFVRNGLDLVYGIDIKLKEALCGFKREIEHLNGNKINLNCDSTSTIIKPGFKRIIPGLGMIRDNTTGNLIIEFNVIFPDSLLSEQIESLKLVL